MCARVRLRGRARACVHACVGRSGKGGRGDGEIRSQFGSDHCVVVQVVAARLYMPRRHTAEQTLTRLTGRVGDLFDMVDDWSREHWYKTMSTVDSPVFEESGDAEIDEEERSKRARCAETSCSRRMPTIGDKVQPLHGRLVGSRFGTWWLGGCEVATVVWVDTDGDFKVLNPRGQVSQIMYRKYFRYSPLVTVIPATTMVDCSSRWPRLGDTVVARDAKAGCSRDGTWRIESNEVAIVTLVDASGDFKLSNPRGEISPLMNRSFFDYNTELWT